jgi:molybdopterin-dependent oxidoreductase alpha subunit
MSASNSTTVPDAEPPRKLLKLSRGAPAEKAVGTTAVVNSMKHIQAQAGLARGTSALLKANQKGGFDCPSCAWPDPDRKRSSFEFCENGAKAIATEATKKRANAEFFTRHSIAELAEMTDFELNDAGRLTEPLLLDVAATHYQPVSWETAIGLVAKELNACASPHDAIFYTSGRASNEAAFLYQLFVRQFGTNNLPDCSNMCHESSGAALNQTIGIGKGTVSLEDIEHTDCVMVIGQNPGTNHPRMLTSLEQTVLNGGKIVSVNPLLETGVKAFAHPQKVSGILGQATPLQSVHVPVRINGDLPFIKGLLKCVLEAEEANLGTIVDQTFIAEHTAGYATMIAELAVAFARCAATATCRATARWASGNGRPPHFWKNSTKSSVSPLRANSATTRSRRSKPCTQAKEGYFSPSVATSSRLHLTPTLPPPPYVVANSPFKFRPNSIAVIWWQESGR